MRAVILAAGIGSRLGNPFPKPLTPLANGKTIMQQQIENLSEIIPIENISIVVGFKKDLIMDAFPEANFIYNNIFDQTNTSKSLLKALIKFPEDSVLWFDGDVVFDKEIIKLFKTKIDQNISFAAVNNSKVGEEEVKYTLDEEHNIAEISKEVENGLGEAVGMNFISSKDIKTLINRLQECDANDYYEKGMEESIKKDNVKFQALDISQYNCVEVDFKEDLNYVNEIINKDVRSK
ncbi:MAG: phosphocholine cytidylyltransferase family protein [Marinifilaceae bacterium]|jgi:choline kinase|nr:phosphocholine cytidylyltransferase family protein [Marinifilaceae bacterium]